MNKYGYKICYKEIGKYKVKKYGVTNTYSLALFVIQNFEKKNKNVFRIWLIKPIKTYIEFKLIWRGCPF